MNHRLLARSALAAAPLFAAAAFAACGGGNDSSTFGPDGGGGDSGGKGDESIRILPPDGSIDGNGGGDSGYPIFEPTGPVTDFPTPVYAGTAPKNSGTLFGPEGTGAKTGGPCLIEPESNVLYPQNWLRPRFTWIPASGQNLFELRLHVGNQKKDLLVYSSNTQWTMPAAMWDALRMDSPTEPMTVSITGGVYNGTTLTGEALGSSYPMSIAPVQATGTIVYWTTSAGTALKGFAIGDETVETVLVPSQVTETTATCIGCHTSTPGGEYVAFGVSGATSWPDALALINPDAGTVGAAPSFLGAGAKTALARDSLGISTFSLAHWATGDRKMVVSFNDQSASTATNVLQWIDLEATTMASAVGTIARSGDSNSAGAPAWSHHGDTIAYVSTSYFCDGRLGAGCDGQPYNGHTDPGATADIYTVPYAGGAGGKATPLAGASSATLEEYYPVFSPDDAWIAFDSIPNGLNMYNQSSAEVSVVPSSGGTATRLAANDPPSCSGITSPGQTNSWPKWGPTALAANGSTFYWLVFSSTRAEAEPLVTYASGGNQTPAGPQLFVTSIVQTGSKIETHGALYLWNQPPTENNHTPAWDTFQVPVIPPPPK
jgi:hypothetical protein